MRSAVHWLEDFEHSGFQGMPQPPMKSVPAFVPSALIASQVGAWETDFGRDIVIGDAATAAMFGVDPMQAIEGLPFAAWARAIHPTDREMFFHKLSRVREHGGLFVVEYRTCPTSGVVRWVLVRGRYERDERTGHIVGRGIVIDITESKLDGRVEDHAFFVMPTEDETPLARVATHALQARQAVEEVDEHEKPALRQAVNTLLWAVGRALAR